MKACKNGYVSGKAGKTGIVKAQAASQAKGHDKYSRINSLPSDKYTLVVDLLKGQSPYHIAEIIQNDWGFNTDITQKHLAHLLEDFRRVNIPLNQIVNPYVIERLCSNLRVNINVLSEFSESIMLQKERLRQARLLEIEAGELLPTTDKQIHILTRLLKCYGDLAIKSGLLQHFSDAFTKDILDEETYLFNETDKIMRVFAGAVLTVEKAISGKKDSEEYSEYES